MKEMKNRRSGLGAADWFYSQPGFHSPAPVVAGDAGHQCVREVDGYCKCGKRHARSTENPDWPHESYCVGCDEQWPCGADRLGRALREL